VRLPGPAAPCPPPLRSPPARRAPLGATRPSRRPPVSVPASLPRPATRRRRCPTRARPAALFVRGGGAARARPCARCPGGQAARPSCPPPGAALPPRLAPGPWPPPRPGEGAVGVGLTGVPRRGARWGDLGVWGRTGLGVACHQWRGRNRWLPALGLGSGRPRGVCAPRAPRAPRARQASVPLAAASPGASPASCSREAAEMLLPQCRVVLA
jgi:hypothetical protein